MKSLAPHSVVYCHSTDAHAYGRYAKIRHLRYPCGENGLKVRKGTSHRPGLSRPDPTLGNHGRTEPTHPQRDPQRGLGGGEGEAGRNTYSIYLKELHMEARIVSIKTSSYARSSSYGPSILESHTALHLRENEDCQHHSCHHYDRA
jgi:hypothetical protein